MSTQPNQSSTVTIYPSFRELAAALAPDLPRPRLRPATEYPATAVDWLWQDKIPVGKVTLLMGDPGLGKSLIAIDAASRVTRGEAFPAIAMSTEQGAGSQTLYDSSPHAPGSVLILSAEDQIADTIRPRLDAAGADPAKVFFASEVTDLRRDLGLLARMLDDAPDCRLIIVDPVNAYVGPSDSHFHTIVRRVLKPLAELAAERKIAILAVTHLRKNAGAAITRATGSMGFAAAARCVWTVLPDAKDPTRNLLLPVKNNLGPKEAGLAFSIEKTAGACAPSIHWHDAPVETPTQEAPSSKRGPEAEDRRHAARWLELALADGPRDSYVVLREGKQNGFGERTLQRALHLVGGMTRKKSFNGGWLWNLTPTASEEQLGLAGVEAVAKDENSPSPQSRAPSPQSRAPSPQSPTPSPQSPAPTKQPVVFDETCRLRENADDFPIENLSPSPEPPPISVAESIRFLNRLDREHKPPNSNPPDDPNSPTGHPVLDQLLNDFRNHAPSSHSPPSTLHPHPSPNSPPSTLNSQPARKKSARSHSRFPTGTDSWHFTRPADSGEPGAMHLGGVSAQALDVSSTRRHEDAI